MNKIFDWDPQSELEKGLRAFDELHGSGLVKTVTERATHVDIDLLAEALNRYLGILDYFLAEISQDVDNSVRHIQPHKDKRHWQGIPAQAVALNYYLIRRVNGWPLPPK